MKKIFCILLISLSFSLTGYESSIASFVALSKEARIGSENPSAANEQAFLLLKPYGNRVSLISAVEHLLAVQCPGYLKHTKIQAIENTPLAGNSSDPVFFLLNEKNELVLVIKAFEDLLNPKCKFLAELSSLDFLAHHQELNIKVPSAVAVGKTYCNDIWYGLLVQTPAHGNRVDSYLNSELKKAKGALREQKLLELRTIFKKAAEAFARENLTHQRLEKTLEPKVIQKFQGRFEKLPAELRYNDLKQIIDDLAARVKETRFIAGYSHPSAHVANVFYEEESGQIWFIDVAKFNNSFDIHENPLGFNAYDLVRFAEAFRKKAPDYLTDEECEWLKDSAIEVYLAATADPNAHLLVEFYTLDRILSRLVKYSQKAQSEDPSKKFEADQVVDMAKRQLERIMNSH